VTFNAKARRRWFGALCLLAAIAMLAAGETMPGKRLDGVGFVLYWLACFVFAALALLTAILDLRVLRREARDEQRALLENTLEGIRVKKIPNPKLKTSKNSQAPSSDSAPPT
jgi:membrane protein implicated in regulation of membrane protease activity